MNGLFRVVKKSLTYSALIRSILFKAYIPYVYLWITSHTSPTAPSSNFRRKLKLDAPLKIGFLASFEFTKRLGDCLGGGVMFSFIGFFEMDV